MNKFVTPQRGKERAHNGHGDSGREYDDQPVVKRTLNEARKEVLASERCPLHVRDVGMGLAYQQTLQRVEAQKRREETADHGQVGHEVGFAGGDAVRAETLEHCLGQRIGETDDHEGEEDADREHHAGIHERGLYSCRAASLIGRNGVHDRR